MCSVCCSSLKHGEEKEWSEWSVAEPGAALPAFLTPNQLKLSSVCLALSVNPNSYVEWAFLLTKRQNTQEERGAENRAGLQC